MDSPQRASNGPLADLHIVDLSSYVAGPSATMTLAQLGADVIRIDPRGGAPDTRRMPLAPNGTSLYWAGLNRGKRSLELDLRSEEGKSTVRRLLSVGGQGHGIVVTNAVGQNWLSYEELRQVRPDLIHVHLAGRSDGSSAVDYTINAETGLPFITGPVNTKEPVNHVLPAWDLLAGLHAALAVLTAERLRRTTGLGQSVHLNLADVAASTLAQLGYVADVVVNGAHRLREGNSLYGSYGCDFAANDGGRFMIVALTERHWKALVALTGTQHAIAGIESSLGINFAEEAVRYEYRDLASALFAPWFARLNSNEARAQLEASSVLWSEYHSVEQMATAPHGLVRRSALFDDVDHPDIGVYPVPRSAATMSGWSAPASRPAPLLGQHSDEILDEWLGTMTTGAAAASPLQLSADRSGR
ncbi:CoA transferase [Arthrobacter sp. AZCC_0090]|uniref:CoA transferase n=1 Tax=Arthrobacter sp. AZCC_0090 TaxID=2735881 RepID=UPI001622B5D3|nr:CoA transferase [Arthrobacter sp. AZCC_0090]MBB6407122.1 2-methylfumaryl-CoA isomerase [Arthrobacter sp. AZCC_0090]